MSARALWQPELLSHSFPALYTLFIPLYSRGKATLITNSMLDSNISVALKNVATAVVELLV